MAAPSPTAILGDGFPQASFERGLVRGPDVIAVDVYGAQQHAPLLDMQIPDELVRPSD
jgi:hypothetical protein